MTYTLFEYVKENLENLLKNQPEHDSIEPSSESKQLCDSMKNAALQGTETYYIFQRIAVNVSK